MNKMLLMLPIASLLLASVISCEGNDLFKTNQPLYLRVIERVRKGEIKTEREKGVKIPEGYVRLPSSAQLPSDLQAASVDREIFVSRPSTNQLIVVFKTWIGKGFNMEGFLFAAEPLKDRDVWTDYYKTGKSVLTIDSVELVLEKPIDKNWYKVSYKLD